MAIKVTKPQTTEITNWEQELAAQAEVAAAMEANSGGGQYFSTRGGILALNDAAVPNNQMAAVVVDSILENVFYDAEYDPDVPAAPVCFAFGRDEATMAPHPNVVERGQAQNATCRGCPMNEFGTAERGKGKACRNTRRLGLIPAGDLTADGRFKAFDDEDHFASAAVAFLKLPVMSVKGYANFVKQVAGALKRPPHGIFSKVKVVPDPKTQFRVLFEPLSAIPNGLMSAVMKRNQEVKATIEQPYSLDVEERAVPEKKPARGVAKPSGRPAVRKGTKY
jgi:hypothetical protein